MFDFNVFNLYFINIFYVIGIHRRHRLTGSQNLKSVLKIVVRRTMTVMTKMTTLAMSDDRQMMIL